MAIDLLWINWKEKKTMIELRTTSIKYVNKCNDGKSASMWYSESFLGFSGLSSIFDDLTRLLAMPSMY